MSRVRVVQPERRSHADNFTVSLVRPGVEDNDGDVGALVVSKVSKRFGRTTILDGVDLTVARGEVVALTGENGAGKSTLMRICAGLERADGGGVVVDGRIGYCPQIPGLFELLTAEDHLVMFGRGAGISRAESLERGRSILSEFDYPLHERTVTRDLSGGTRQKLNLALALLSDPTVLLLDEPYQGFDRGTYVNFWDHCARWRDQGRAVVVVTHMLAELERADRVVELPAHPSRNLGRSR
jgi:ABC-type multidrug transport system ATPase subunit